MSTTDTPDAPDGSDPTQVNVIPMPRVDRHMYMMFDPRQTEYLTLIMPDQKTWTMQFTSDNRVLFRRRRLPSDDETG